MAEYIEREALLEDIENACVFSGRPEHQNPKQMGARLVVQRIRCEPAADVAPVVHGKWDTVFFQRHEGELASYTHVCPMCKFLYRNLHFNGYNYCPNCGARIDGE